MKTRASHLPYPRRPRGFTLLEVLLALSIAIGLLAVVLHFYQQIARLRDATLADTSKLAALRLSMDRIAAELRTASARPGTFRGSAQDLEFVRNTPTDPARWPRSTNNPSAAPSSPSRHIAYRLSGTNELGLASGVERSEEPTINASTDDTSDESLDDLVGLAEPAPAPTETTSVVIPELRHLALRYWNGAAWLDAWSAPQLPRGVEITLAADPVPANAAPGTLPSELFRRVVALPCSTPITDTNAPPFTPGGGVPSEVGP